MKQTVTFLEAYQGGYDECLHGHANGQLGELPDELADARVNMNNYAANQLNHHYWRGWAAAIDGLIRQTK